MEEGKSRRAIDLYAAELYARIDERLKHLSDEQKEIAKKAGDTYYAMFGGPGVADVGLSETVRRLVRNWAIFAMVGGSLIGFVSGLFGFWIQKKFLDAGNAGIMPSVLPGDEWSKMRAKRVLRFHNPTTGKFEYYYMLPGSPPPASQSSQ